VCARNGVFTRWRSTGGRCRRQGGVAGVTGQRARCVAGESARRTARESARYGAGGPAGRGERTSRSGARARDTGSCACTNGDIKGCHHPIVGRCRRAQVGTRDAAGAHGP
jgi:hypothetical protein